MKKIKFSLYFILLLFIIVIVRLLVVWGQIKIINNEKTYHLIGALDAFYSDNLRYPLNNKEFGVYLKKKYDETYIAFFNDPKFKFRVDSSNNTFNLIYKKHNHIRKHESRNISLKDYNIINGFFHFGGILIFSDKLSSDKLLNINDLTFINSNSINSLSVSDMKYFPVYEARKNYYESIFGGEYEIMFFLAPYRFKVVMEINSTSPYHLICADSVNIHEYDYIFNNVYDSFKHYLDSNGINRILIPITLFDTIPPSNVGVQPTLNKEE